MAGTEKGRFASRLSRFCLCAPAEKPYRLLRGLFLFDPAVSIILICRLFLLEPFLLRPLSFLEAIGLEKQVGHEEENHGNQDGAEGNAGSDGGNYGKTSDQSDKNTDVQVSLGVLVPFHANTLLFSYLYLDGFIRSIK